MIEGMNGDKIYAMIKGGGLKNGKERRDIGTKGD
jgi:hypothetical protein